MLLAISPDKLKELVVVFSVEPAPSEKPDKPNSTFQEFAKLFTAQSISTELVVIFGVLILVTSIHVLGHSTTIASVISASDS